MELVHRLLLSRHSQGGQTYGSEKLQSDDLSPRDVGTMDRLADREQMDLKQGDLERVDLERADRELERRIKNFLAARHVPGLRHLDVQARAGTVTLSGRVLTFYEKQLCNQCCRRVAGVTQLINDVDVVGVMPAAATVA